MSGLGIKMLKVEHASVSDLDAMMQIFELSKVFMREHGNATQWINGYPSREIVLNDISKNQAYKVIDDEDPNARILAIFTFFVGNDPTYDYIEGQWLNNKPYGVIHRIASSGIKSGISDYCIDYCRSLHPNIRIDTHKNNTFMQQSILRNKFKYCGIIYIRDGSPRLAYQRED